MSYLNLMAVMQLHCSHFHFTLGSDLIKNLITLVSNIFFHIVLQFMRFHSARELVQSNCCQCFTEVNGFTYR